MAELLAVGHTPATSADVEVAEGDPALFSLDSASGKGRVYVQKKVGQAYRTTATLSERSPTVIVSDAGTYRVMRKESTVALACGASSRALVSREVKTYVDRVREVRGTGTAAHRPTGTYGLSFSGGANTPALVENINGEVWVTTPVGAYVEITFPNLPTAKLCPKSFMIEAEADDWSAVNQFNYYIAATGYSAFWYRTFSAAVTSSTAEPSMTSRGVRQFWSDQHSLTAGGTGADFATTQCQVHKVRISPVAGRSARVCVKKIDHNVEDIPSISLTFDDGYVSVIDNALPILKARGLRGSFGIIMTEVGKSGYATMEQLREWVAAGNECVPHGPIDGSGNITKHGTVSGAVEDMVAHREWLIRNGLSDEVSASCYIWPQGVFFMDGDRRNPSIRDAAAAAGFLGGRGTELAQFFNSYHVGADMRRWNVPIIGHNQGANETAEATNITTLLGRLDALATDKKSACLMFHYVGANLGIQTDITVANFTTLMDKVASLVATGQVINPVFSRQIAWSGTYRT